MMKYLKLAFLINVSLSSLALASEANTNTYSLDEATIENAKIKLNDNNKIVNKTKQITSEDVLKSFDVIKEEISGGYIEKLLTKDGIIVAEKKVINNEIKERTLYEYHPNGNISRKIISYGNADGFYAEEYYTNGKKSSTATYLNNQNKIGIEKKYDIYGVLRQEIPWEEENKEKAKEQNQRTSVIKGRVNTYYPSGKIAASFSGGSKGKNVFFDENGKIIHEINDAEILSFKPDINKEDCGDLVIDFSLGELVELFEDEGDISYNKCGLPYKEVFVYEINNIIGVNNKKLSFDEKGMLRRITTYKQGKKDGIERKYDGNGNLTAEIPYVQGTKNGIANGYFPTRELAFRKRYENGKVVGNLNCYFPTGEIAAEIPYKNGLKDGNAKILTPKETIVEFQNGEQITKENKIRKQVSYLNLFSDDKSQCLNINEHKEMLMLDVKSKENSIKEELNITPIKECKDLSTYKPINNIFACYVDNKIRAYFPPAYVKNKFAVLTINDENNKKTHSIQYNQKMRQGIARAYGSKDNIIKEISYNNGNMSETSRIFYESGLVKYLLSKSDDDRYELINSYNEDGSLSYSLSYKDGNKEQTYLSTDKNDVYIKFYEDKPENIREVNKLNPLNFIEYNLSIGEYLIFNGGRLIKTGKICGYDTISKDIELIEYTPPQKEEVKYEAKEAVETQEKGEEALIIKENASPKNEELPDIKILDELEKEANDAMDIVGLEELEKEIEAIKQEHNALVKEASSIPVEPIKEVENKEVKTNEQPVEPKVSKENIDIDILETKVEKVVPSIGLNAVPFQNKKEELQDYNVENAIIPTAKEKKEEELASKNIGPIAKPDINDLSKAVAKEHVELKENKKEENLESRTEKFYYPNGNLRKTIKTKGSRTEEVKEYSKTGLLLTDTIYDSEGILIEKYYGSGEIRRKTQKAYTDNVIMGFISRIDFYNTGLPRYEIKRNKDTLLFEDKEFYPNGKLKKETIQTSPLVFVEKEFNKDGKLLKEHIKQGQNTLLKEYDNENKIQKLLLNNKEVPVSMDKDSQKLLSDSAKSYNKNGKLASEFVIDKNSNIIKEYYDNGELKIEIVFYNNGEISLKTYTKDKQLDKFSYLSPDGKLHIQKPEVRTIPSYRERYWVDYNNPKWIENQDKYSINSIGALNLDTIAYMLTEQEIEIPEILKNIYMLYQK